MWIKNKINSWISTFKYKYSFLLVLFSPLKGLKLKFYFGKIAVGTPYFLPRKFVKCDIEDAYKAWEEMSDFQRTRALETRSMGDWITHYTKSYTKGVPVKWFHIHFTTLGWKTKWDEFRHEWNPLLSIVLLNRQFVMFILPNVDFERSDSYWEIWLYYHFRTDKELSKTERLKQVFKQHSCTWISSKDGVDTTVDHYLHVLKNKYIDMYKEWKDQELLNIYMEGFYDELDGDFDEDKYYGQLQEKSYLLGKDHAIIGDDVSSIDKLTDEEVLNIIKS